MDAKCNAIRHVLSHAAPIAAIKIIKSFALLPDEEETIILHDVKGNSLEQIAEHLCMSTETVRRRRKSGYLKMLDALNM